MWTPSTLKATIQSFLNANVKRSTDTAMSKELGVGISQEHLLANQPDDKVEGLQAYVRDRRAFAIQASKEHEYLDTGESEAFGFALFTRLPEGLVLRISRLLDEVSLLCLKYTNSRLRQIISMNEAQISKCARWTMLTLLEEDLLGKGCCLPDRLACWYCKEAHSREEFGVRDGNVGYGVERLCVIEVSQPNARFCWRYIPKLIDYTAGEAKANTPPDPKSQKDKWVWRYRWICFHCGNRVIRDENDKFCCPLCSQECEICGFHELSRIERHGPRRPFESVANIRFVRREEKNYKLEIRDINGIRRPKTLLPPEPKTWPERNLKFEMRQHYRVRKCLFHPLRVNHNRFSLYSPVDSSECLDS